MQNLDLTRWLEMVWDALKAQDEVTRNHLLHAADLFLQDENQEADSETACGSADKGCLRASEELSEPKEQPRGSLFPRGPQDLAESGRVRFGLYARNAARIEVTTPLPSCCCPDIPLSRVAI